MADPLFLVDDDIVPPMPYNNIAHSPAFEALLVNILGSLDPEPYLTTGRQTSTSPHCDCSGFSNYNFSMLFFRYHWPMAGAWFGFGSCFHNQSCFGFFWRSGQTRCPGKIK